MENISCLQLERTIGSGTFGKVKRALYLPTGHALAVKILNKHKIANKKDALRIEREIAILKKINHPNLLKLYQLIVTSKNYLLVTQLAEGQELYQRINRKGHLQEGEAGLLFVQLLDGVMHLKNRGIAHRDIKPENIILEGDKLTLIDFGLGGLYNEGERLWSSCGSHCYAAPEMMNGKHYDPEKSQVWALGVTLYAMLSGNLPFQHDNPSQLLKLMLTSKYEPIPQISSALQQLLRCMIQPKPSKRYSLKQVKSHVWIKAMQHEFVVELQEKQWNEELLKQMGRQLSLRREELVKRIEEDFGQETIAYHFRNQKKQRQYPLHSGPVHLNYLFKTVPLAQSFINSQNPTCHWLTRSEALTPTHLYRIKQIKGGFYYVVSEPIPSV